MKAIIIFAAFVLLVADIGYAAVDDPTGLPCSSSAGCGAGYCCVSTTRPRGKRQISAYSGTCHEMGQTGDGCFVSAHYEGSLVYYVECPCAAGTTCHGNGQIDMPLGEMGVCR